MGKRVKWHFSILDQNFLGGGGLVWLGSGLSDHDQKVSLVQKTDGVDLKPAFHQLLTDFSFKISAELCEKQFQVTALDSRQKA